LAKDHWRLCPTRSIVKHREYVATLEGLDTFREQLNRCYSQTVQQQPHQVVFLGDGAAWIWLMATLLFPDAIQILDFFHVSEYLWEVARHAFPKDAGEQRSWVETQQEASNNPSGAALLKRRSACHPRPKPCLKH
jgi:hypothetical protein